MGQKDVSGMKISVGDCWLKDKILKGSETTRDDSNGNKCTTSYKKLGKNSTLEDLVDIYF